MNQKNTYLTAYELNQSFGNCNDDRFSLYFAGLKNNTPWVEDVITNEDSNTGDRLDLLAVLNRDKQKIIEIK